MALWSLNLQEVVILIFGGLVVDPLNYRSLIGDFHMSLTTPTSQSRAQAQRLKIAFLATTQL